MDVAAHARRAARSRPAKIVSVCVQGRPAARESQNPRRFDLLMAVIRQIRAHAGWEQLDAILFPAGYFRLDQWFGPLPGPVRLQLLDESDIGSVCRSAARRLGLWSPDCCMVVGVDTNNVRSGWRGDQMVVAYDHSSCVGVARKIYPVDGDTSGHGRAPYLLFERDADDPLRIIQLPNGDNAVLSACYDAFALAELRLGPTSKLSAMRYLAAERGWRWFEKGEAHALMQRMAQQLDKTRPSISLTAIHGFERPGQEVYWQRHGIATASAALGGALSVGAAHFRHELPCPIGSAPLAATQVWRDHLTQSGFRKARALLPLDGFEVTLAAAPRLRALVRLYQDD